MEHLQAMLIAAIFSYLLISVMTCLYFVKAIREAADEMIESKGEGIGTKIAMGIFVLLFWPIVLY